MSKLDSYLQAEAQAQFSDEHRSEIEESRVGLGKLSPRLARRVTNQEGWNLRPCSYCGHVSASKNIREAAFCETCQPFSSQIESYMRQNAINVLRPEDKKMLANSVLNKRTRRRGPFFNVKKPRPSTPTPRPIDNIL